MLAVHQDNAEKSIGHMLQDLGGAIPALLVLIGRRMRRLMPVIAV